MNNFKNILMSIFIVLGLILISSFLINILSYFDILSPNIYKGLIIFFSVISTFAGGFILGSKSNEKAYLKGLILAIVLISLFIILSFIFNKELSLASAIYYLIIIITSIISSSFGINKKTTDK